QKFFPFPAPHTAAKLANAAPTPSEIPPPPPACESIAALPAVPTAAPAPAVLSLRCAARSQPCSAPPAIPAPPDASAAQFASPTLIAKCCLESSARTAKENSPLAVCLPR